MKYAKEAMSENGEKMIVECEENDPKCTNVILNRVEYAMLRLRLLHQEIVKAYLEGDEQAIAMHETKAEEIIKDTSEWADLILAKLDKLEQQGLKEAQ